METETFVWILMILIFACVTLLGSSEPSDF